MTRDPHDPLASGTFPSLLLWIAIARLAEAMPALRAHLQRQSRGQ